MIDGLRPKENIKFKKQQKLNIYKIQVRNPRFRKPIIHFGVNPFFLVSINFQSYKMFSKISYLNDFNDINMYLKLYLQNYKTPHVN